MIFNMPESRTCIQEHSASAARDAATGKLHSTEHTGVVEVQVLEPLQYKRVLEYLSRYRIR